MYTSSLGGADGVLVSSISHSDVVAASISQGLVVYGAPSGSQPAEAEELLESCELLEAELQDQLFQWPGDDWEELILFHESLNTGSKTELQLPVSGIFVSRLLQSGFYQQHSLWKVLQKHRRNISETDFVFLTREGLQREVLAVIDTENMDNDKMEHLMQWRNLYRDYFLSWMQSNVPYSMMLDNRTASIGLIRRQCVSFRRSLSKFEKVSKGEIFGL
ncbi:hypothetical protein L7F22_029308 [Adiantum nelumboides]|nr:hypothetical protein [Adiantum nelumboides]